MEVMKQLRQRAIRDLLEQRTIRTQQELAEALRDRGFRTTQATISRDVAELGLIKVARDGSPAYALPPRLIEAETSGEDRLRKLLHELPIEIHESGLLLVLRTLPGSAPSSSSQSCWLISGPSASTPASTADFLRGSMEGSSVHLVDDLHRPELARPPVGSRPARARGGEAGTNRARRA